MLKELFDTKRQYINHFFEKLDVAATEKILHLLLHCQGTIFFTGVGKSGIIAEKIAATMTSTGTRAFFLSPTNALHGDIGIVSSQDVCVFISKSGESEELLALAPCLRNRGAQLVGVFSSQETRLSRFCHLSVILPLEKELCPFDKVPTTSSVIQMIFGDVLSVALMRLKDFGVEQYALNHPAGALGKRMNLRVRDLMLTGSNIPQCQTKQKLVDVLYELSNKKCGCILLLTSERKLQGIFTDGDLRRALQEQGGTVLEKSIESLMNTRPRCVDPDILALDALKMMEAANQKISVLPVVENNGVVVGLIRIHDIIQAGL